MILAVAADPKAQRHMQEKKKKTLPQLIVFYDEYCYNALSISLHLLLYCPFPFALFPPVHVVISSLHQPIQIGSLC